jgi:hypothetical protein
LSIHFDLMLLGPSLPQSAAGLVKHLECLLGLFLRFSHEGNALLIHPFMHQPHRGHVTLGLHVMIRFIKVFLPETVLFQLLVSALEFILRPLGSKFMCNLLQAEIASHCCLHHVAFLAIKARVHQQIPSLEKVW